MSKTDRLLSVTSAISVVQIARSTDKTRPLEKHTGRVSRSDPSPQLREIKPRRLNGVVPRYAVRETVVGTATAELIRGKTNGKLDCKANPSQNQNHLQRIRTLIPPRLRVRMCLCGLLLNAPSSTAAFKLPIQIIQQCFQLRQRPVM